MSFYIFHRHRVCLVDCVDLICSLYSWQEDFGSSCLATLPLGFNYVSFSTSACGLSTGVFSRGCLGGLGFAPVRARCGGGAAAWVAWVLAEPGTQGSWGLGKQDIYWSRSIWKPVLANTLQYCCLEKPPDKEAWQATVYRVSKSWARPKWPCTHRCKIFLPVAALRQWDLSMKGAQLLGLWGPWQHKVCRDMDCLCPRSYGPHCSSVTQLCPTSCDTVDCSTPRFPVYHQLLELTQSHVHWIGDAIQPSHPLSSPSPPAFNLSQHQGLLQGVSFMHQVAKVLEFQLQHQSFQWIFRTDFLEDWLVWSLCSPRDSQESSPIPQFKSINSSAVSFLYGPTLTSVHDYC